MGLAKSNGLFADNSVIIGPETGTGMDLKLEPIQQQKLLLFEKDRDTKRYQWMRNNSLWLY